MILRVWAELLDQAAGPPARWWPEAAGDAQAAREAFESARAGGAPSGVIERMDRLDAVELAPRRTFMFFQLRAGEAGDHPEPRS